MPFDGKTYEPTDDVLRWLIKTNHQMSVTDGGDCIWNALSDVSAGAENVRTRLDAVTMVARELMLPIAVSHWQAALIVIYHFNDTHSLRERIALVDRAIAARSAELMAA